MKINEMIFWNSLKEFFIEKKTFNWNEIWRLCQKWQKHLQFTLFLLIYWAKIINWQIILHQKFIELNFMIEWDEKYIYS